MKIGQELTRIIKEQSTDKIKQFLRVFQNFDSFQKIFGTDTKAAAKWIYKNDTIALFISNYSRNNIHYLNQVFSDLLYLIFTLKPKKIEFSLHMVDFISSEYFKRTYFPEETDIIKIHKKLGVYKTIVDNGFWIYSNVYPWYAYFLINTNKLSEKETIQDLLYYTEIYEDVFDKNEEKYFQFLESKKILDWIVINNTNISEEFEMVIMNCFFNKKDPRFYQFLPKLLTDIVQEGDQYYLDLNSREELAPLFYEEDQVQNVLSDDYGEFFNDSVSDFENDCVDSLTDKGKLKVIAVILEKLEGQEVDYTMEGQEDNMIVSRENINILIRDNSAFTEFLECDDLYDIKCGMEYCFDDAYNMAYESECYSEIMKKVKNYFGDEGKFHSLPKRRNPDGKGGWTEYVPEVYRINITNMLPQIMGEYMQYEYRNSLSYYGELITLLKEIKNKIRIRLPDYVWDHRELIELYNEIISDNLEDRS